MMPMSLKVGRMRERIVIQNATVSQNDYGEKTKSWSDAGTFWASITPISSAEIMRGARAVGELTHRIRMRYQPNVTINTLSRIKHVDPTNGTRYFNIEGPPRNLEERNHVLEFLATEISGESA